MKLQKFCPGDMIINENSEGDEIFFIKKGRVKVFKDIEGQAIDLGELGEGDFFGEMSMFLGKHRTASVKALEDCEVAVGGKSAFLNTLRSDSSYAMTVLSTMVNRLNKAHEVIEELEGQRKAYEILLTPFGSTEEDLKPKKRFIISKN